MRCLRQIRELIRLTQTPRDHKQIVFYCEGPNYFPHLQGLLQETLELVDQPCCYISSNRDDPGLGIDHPKLKQFETDEGHLRNWLFASLEADLVILTMPDLEQYQLKRSPKVAHYAYVQHSLVSQHMIYRTGAFDHFDSVFCAGPHHIEELQTLERIGGLKKKLLVEHGYGRLDAIRREAEQRPAEAVVDATEPLHVLVAPSWGPNGVIETIGLELTNTLLEAGFFVTVRPHPQTAKLSPATTAAIREKFDDHEHFTYEYGVSGQESLHRSDIMISDWSGAALEYAFGLGKPVMFVDVPRKINNPDYLAVGIEPFEASIREKIGGILNPADLAELPEKLREQCASWDPEELPIHEYVFNLGDADKVGAKAIIRQAKALVSSKA